jgi:hypothetical protein
MFIRGKAMAQLAYRPRCTTLGITSNQGPPPNQPPMAELPLILKANLSDLVEQADE